MKGTALRRAGFLLALCAISAGVTYAQTDAGRPLRAVPSTPPDLPAFHETPPSLHSPLLDPSVLEQPLTQYYIRQYSSPAGAARLNAALKRGAMYLSFIREEIARRNLPPELLYVPLIESGFQISARSRSGAVGLWQFMLNSIAPFDMKVSDMIDERKDFQKSTRGALQKLEENFNFLGNWPLALAAYNAGLGAVNRAAQRNNTKDYWLLCEKKILRTETVHYVPKLAAASWVLSQPRRFGIDDWIPGVEWETVPVGRQVSLDILAAEAGIESRLLRQANMELTFGITPADASFRLKVPAAHASQIAETIARSDLKLLTVYRYVIKYGDTLSALSRHYDVPLKLIEQHNPGIGSRYLRIGETVIIPALRETTPYTGSAVPGTHAALPAFAGNHLVKRGETLWSIAAAYSTDPQTLARENNMELNQTLREGKNLKVPIYE